MIWRRFLSACLFLAISVILTAAPHARADSQPTGLWYATMNVTEGAYAGYSNKISITFEYVEPYGLLASMFIPELGLFNDYLPVSIDGNSVTIGDPAYAVMTGEIADSSIAGSFYTYLGNGTWKGQKYVDPEVLPGDTPGPSCEELPPIYCIGDENYCGELVYFSPDMDSGYDIETYDEYRYIRRDLMMLIKYATAKVACKSNEWDYGNKGPLGLIDMSDEYGFTPMDDYGNYRHPPGTHEVGKDIDAAYFQLFASNNLGRPVGLNYDNHLVEPPYDLDKWRTALFISYLAEHPRLRVVGVDGQIGLMFDGSQGPEESGGTFDELVEMGWIDPNHRPWIPLAYEVEDTGRGWYRFHHHHMHISMNPIADIIASLEINPETLNRNSSGHDVTANIEFDNGIDIYQLYWNTVALIVNGHTMVPVRPKDIKVSDYNLNGISDLTIKFDRQEVLDSIGEGNVEVSITGLVDNKFFQDSDMIRVIGPPTHSGQAQGKSAVPFVRPGGRSYWPE